MTDELTKDMQRRMTQALDMLHKELGGLRTGRASVNLLEHIKVDSYGSMTPLNQVATVSAPESRLLTVQVWDRGLAKAVEKAIRDANLGLNPAAEGQVIRVPLPALNEERRSELSKIAAKYAEDARIAVRNVRRDGMDTLKKREKDKEISEDEHKRFSADIQKVTDEHIKKIDAQLEAKQKEIMQV
ncbi:MAG: ribosome recycling factor [Alphaproteobacteria bacterium]|nr:ribosome recycling factor [Alphaproteobacteria bacterium]